MAERLIIWGAGELGWRVGAGWPGATIGFTRTTARHADLRQRGIEPRLGAPLAWLEEAAQGRATYLVLALPGHEQQGEALAQLQRMLPPTRVVLISTTGYYGSQGGRLDEASPAGDEARARRIAGVEEMFQKWAGERGVVLRAGGLYGTDRGPFAALRRRGTTQSPFVPNQVLPLIHYDDLATVVLCALLRPAVEALYLAVVPPCPTRLEFYTAACAELDIDLPPQATPQVGAPADYNTQRLERDLLPDPTCPDWRAILAT